MVFTAAQSIGGSPARTRIPSRRQRLVDVTDGLEELLDVRRIARPESGIRVVPPDLSQFVDRDGVAVDVAVNELLMSRVPRFQDNSIHLGREIGMADQGVDKVCLFLHAVRLAEGHEGVAVEGVQHGEPGIHRLRLGNRDHLRAGLSLRQQPGSHQHDGE
jgi:hypothetical protein